MSGSNKHCVDRCVYAKEGFKWKYAWVLDGVVEFEKPISYYHKSGSVIWVCLDQEAKKNIMSGLELMRIKNLNDYQVVGVWSRKEVDRVIIKSLGALSAIGQG